MSKAPAANVTAVAAAGDEAAGADDPRPPLDLALCPPKPALRLLAAEEPAGGAPAEVRAEEVRDVVAEHRAGSGRGDHQQYRELAVPGHHACGDDHGLAGHDGKERVHRDDRKLHEVCDGAGRDEVLEPIEDARDKHVRSFSYDTRLDTPAGPDQNGQGHRGRQPVDGRTRPLMRVTASRAGTRGRSRRPLRTRSRGGRAGRPPA